MRNQNVKDAKKVLKELELELNINIEIKEEIREEDLIIKEQIPKPGIKVRKGSKISVEI